MQEIWAKILAGEIKKPQSYSLRTLELLKNLSKWEAETFMKFAALEISSGNGSFILNFKNEQLLQDKNKLNFNERLLLEELGLLTANDLQFKVFPTKEEVNQSYFIIGNHLICLTKPENQPEQQLQVLVFTKIGEQLLNLVQSNPVELDYIQLLASKLRNTEDYKLKYSVIMKRNEDGGINHTPMVDIPLTKEELDTKKEEIEKN